MDAFPFTKEDWGKLVDVTLDVTNATLADDDVLRQCQFNELLGILDELRSRYGDHPVLRETEADFEDDPLRRVELYRSALRSADEHHLPTLSIRISFARVLLEDFGDANEAAKELVACRTELAASTDKSDIRDWSTLMSQCQEDGPTPC